MRNYYFIKYRWYIKISKKWRFPNFTGISYTFFSVVHGLYFDEDSGSTFLIVDACGPGKKDAPPNYLIKIPHENRNFEIHFDQNVGEASEILKQEPKKSVDKFIFTILKTKYVNAYKGFLALYIWYHRRWL